MNARQDIRVGMIFALVVMGSSIASGQNAAEAAAEVHSGWSVPFDGSDSRPVVHDGALYVGSFDGAVYAFDVTTGRQKWRYQTGEGLTSGPQIIVTDSNEFADQLRAAAAASAKKPRGKREVSATPVVLNGVVYIGSKDQYFYALDAASGKLKWRTELGARDFDEAIVTSQLLVAYGHGMGGAPDVLYGLDSRDGRIKWSTEDNGSATYPSLRENVVYFGLRANHAAKSFSLNAVDLETGKPQWTTQLNGQSPGTPVLSMDTLYVAAYEGGDNMTSTLTVTHVYAVDLSTGKLLWDFKAGEAHGFTSRLTVGPKHLFLVTKEGLSAVRKSSGELGWFLEGDYAAQTVQLHDSLYLQSGPLTRKESIFGIDPDTGTIIWRASPGKNVYLRSVSDDAVYVSAETSLLALRRSDGKKLWKFKTGGSWGKGTNIGVPPTRFGRQLIFPTKTSSVWGGASIVSIRGGLYSIDAETGKLK